MTFLFWGLGLCCSAFLLPVIIWRIRTPIRQTNALFMVFFGSLAIGLLGLWNGSESITMFGVPAPVEPLEYFHIALFFISATLGYIVFYSALEVDSPSMVMVYEIAQAGSEGVDENYYVQTMTDDILVKPRVRNLLGAQIAYLDGEKYCLTPKGVTLAKTFTFYRKLLGVSENVLGG